MKYITEHHSAIFFFSQLHQYNAEASIEQYPLALKMMFNYEIQSNAMAILKAMYKETVPAKRRNYSEMDEWEKV